MYSAGAAAVAAATAAALSVASLPAADAPVERPMTRVGRMVTGFLAAAARSSTGWATFCFGTVGSCPGAGFFSVGLSFGTRTSTGMSASDRLTFDDLSAAGASSSASGSGPLTGVDAALPYRPSVLSADFGGLFSCFLRIPLDETFDGVAASLGLCANASVDVSAGTSLRDRRRDLNRRITSELNRRRNRSRTYQAVSSDVGSAKLT